MIRTVRSFLFSPVRGLRLTATALVGCLLVGCAGGSGSSGFDISPLAENAFIVTALEEGRCVDADGLAICPTDTAGLVLPDGIDRPGAPAPDVFLETDIGEASTVCTPVAASTDSCRIDVFIDGSGFPAGARVNLALRRADSQGAWTAGEAVLLDSGGTIASLEVAREALEVQLAALVYFATEPLAPGEIETLSQARPDVAFVSQPLTLTFP